MRSSIDHVFAALTTNEGFAGWWASEAEVNVQVGGRIDLTFEGLTILSFRYVTIQKNEVVEIQCISGPGAWQDSELLFEIEKTEDQVFVTLTHQNAACDENEFLYFSTKWTCYLLSLKSWVESGKGRPYPNDIKIHLGD